MKRITGFVTLSILLTLACSRQPSGPVLTSPDGRIEFRLTDGESLSYTVRYNGTEVIAPSRLGLQLSQSPALGTNARVSDVSFGTLDETFKPVIGKHKEIRNHCNTMKLTCSDRGFPGRSLNIEVRAFNDGVAFRYIVPEANGIKEYILTDELTTFNFHSDHSAWMADYGSFTTHQEEEFWKKPLSAIKQESIIGIPLLVEVNSGTLLAITEANLRDWAGMYLAASGSATVGGVSLKSKLSPLPGNPKELVHFSASQPSPWRVIMLAGHPGRLTESEIVMCLAEPLALDETDWIKPGLCAWDNWWSGDVQMDTETLKKYIQFASDMGFPYQLIDWQWYGPFNTPGSDVTSVNPNVNMEEVLSFAKEKNVRCWVWLWFSDIDRNMEQAFALYEKWGIAGVKIDFMARDDQEMVRWYSKVVSTAAKYHLLVNFHGAYKNTGIERTFPNLMVREGVLGNEYNGWSNRITPEHNVTLPFTRMLAGPMDYTPGGFLNCTKENFVVGHPTRVMGTRCHELAKFVVYFGPITTVCDHPDHYYGQTGLEFLKKVKTVTDDYKVIDGYPGEFIVVCRKSGDEYLLAAMTNSQPRELTLNLRFLGEGSYQALIYADAEDADRDATLAVEKHETLNAASKLKFELAPGGGWVAWLKKN